MYEDVMAGQGLPHLSGMIGVLHVSWRILLYCGMLVGNDH